MWRHLGLSDDSRALQGCGQHMCLLKEGRNVANQMMLEEPPFVFINPLQPCTLFVMTPFDFQELRDDMPSILADVFSILGRYEFEVHFMWCFQR